MKKIFTVIITLCCTMQLHLVSAQTAEIAQLLLNVEKLAQLKQILKDMKKGYEIVSTGYGTIKNIAEGNYTLHDAFLDGLLMVNPELRKYPRVADIIEYQKKVLKEYHSAFNRFKSGGRFTAEEIDYMATVYGNLFKRSLDNLDELTLVLTSGELRMSDDERLEAIDRLFLDMQGLLTDLRSFNKKISQVDHQRAHQEQEMDLLRQLYGQ